MTEVTRPFAPAPDKATSTSAEFSKDKKTRTYYFPRRVLLQLPSLERVSFEMGAQEVPIEILEHPASLKWLTDNGAKPHVRTAPKLERLPEITDHHVRFLQQRGYANVRTVPDAIRFVTAMDDKAKPGFFAEAAEWKGPRSNDSLDPNDTPGTAGEGEQTDDAGKPAEDPNGASDSPASDEPGDKAVSARAGDAPVADSHQGRNRPASGTGKSAGKGK